MDQLLQQFVDSVARPGVQPLSPAELMELTERYPSFPAPAVALLRDPDAELTDDAVRRLQRIIALNCRDAEQQAALSSPDGRVLSSFYPPRPVTAATTTDDAITTFLESYGHSTPEEDRLLEQMIFNPVPDYGAVLSMDDEEAPAEEDENSSIDAFVKAFAAPEPEEPEQPAAPETPAAPAEVHAAVPAAPQSENQPPRPRRVAESGSLSESLAKIYIKQRRYDKAYEIIKHLCLKNPKKSVYFADQLRFLQKLMLNSKYKSAKNN